MKKLLGLVLVAILLVGCGEMTHEEKVENIATDVNVQAEINDLQGQLDRGEITEKYARERFEQILRERKRDNSGDPDAILDKMDDVYPEAADMFRDMLEKKEAEKAAAAE